MPVDLNTTGDFTATVDTLEPLTLLRRGSTAQIAIAAAWRYVDRTTEQGNTNGYVTAAGVTWQFEWADAISPKVGDRVQDTAGDCYTLLAVERLPGGTRLRCESRNLRIAHGLDCRVAIEQAVWEDLGSGLEITGWTVLRPVVHARIQLERVEVDETIDPAGSSATYCISLENPPLLDHNHRIVDANGTVYQLFRFENAERIDAVAQAFVRREG